MALCGFVVCGCQILKHVACFPPSDMLSVTSRSLQANAKPQSSGCQPLDGRAIKAVQDVTPALASCPHGANGCCGCLHNGTALSRIQVNPRWAGPGRKQARAPWAPSLWLHAATQKAKPTRACGALLSTPNHSQASLEALMPPKLTPASPADRRSKQCKAPEASSQTTSGGGGMYWFVNAQSGAKG